MDYDVIIIGAGPGGYHAANLLAQAGKKVLIVEKNKLGGVCLNEGCIPTKALISISEKIASVRRDEIVGLSLDKNISINKDLINEKVTNASLQNGKAIEYLFKKNGVNYLIGEASIIDKNSIKVGSDILKGEYIVIATGSQNKSYTQFSNGNTIDKVISSSEALTLKEIPNSITIVGGGAIGVEFAYIFSNLGSEVTILEYLPTLLPNIDSECGKNIERSFKKLGIKVITDAKLLSIRNKDNENNNNYIVYSRKGKDETIYSEYILISLGREANSKIDGIQNLSLDMDRGFIKVNNNFKTNIDNIYAIGDVVSGKPMLAHTAYYETEIMVNNILNGSVANPDYNLVPYCIYCEPQVAGFGISEDLAKKNGYNYEILKSFFKASGKAIAIDKTDGFIKLVIDSKKRNILGAFIVGENATELIHILLPIARLKLPVETLLETIFAHPTLSELIKDTISTNLK